MIMAYRGQNPLVQPNYKHMPVKKTKTDNVEEKVEVKATITLEMSKRDLIVELLKKRVHGLFDREPNGSMSHQGVEKLADEILSI